MTDWDDAFANSAYIPNADAIAAEWPREALAFRETVKAQLDVAYGRRPRECYDLFMPKGRPEGLFIFIHGGYWMAFGKSDWSHLAAGAMTRGWAAALPGYDLCPDVRISDITRQIGAAISHAASRISGPLIIAGHSAGAHLAVRMICEDSPLETSIRSRIFHVLGISGLYDLRPLRQTALNETLRLTEEEAARESPALLAPCINTGLTAWVGAEERPEFRRQSALLAAAWSSHVMRMHHVEAPDRHHFNVIAPLADPRSALTECALTGCVPAHPADRRHEGPNPA